MSAFAPSQYQMPGAGEIPSPQPTDEELEKLQEIHELINLMLRDIPAITHATARPYAIPTAGTIPYAANPYSAMPYAWSFQQLPWSRAPYGQM
jgi:hypothetical protein